MTKPGTTSTQNESRADPGRHVLVLVLYLLLTLGLTFPLVTHFGDHVPGSETWGLDEFAFLWNYWWVKHAIFDLGTNPLYTKFTFYPVGVSFALYTLALLNAIVAIPVEFTFGYVVASNSLLVFSFVAGAFGTFLLADYLLAHSAQFAQANPRSMVRFGASILAGIAFAFTSSRFVYASLGHYNFVSSQYVPFYVLFFVKTVREDKWRNALLGGLFAALATLTEMTFAVFLALFSLVYLVVVWRERRWERRLVARLMILAVATVLLASPVIVPSFVEILTAGYSLPGWGHAEKLLVDLFGFITPTSLQPLNRNWTQELDLVRQGISRFADVNTVFLGYATLALAVLAGCMFRKTLKAWVVSAVVFAVLALGPVLYINGRSQFDFDGLQVTFPLPFLLLHYIPFLKENRVPNRFSILVVLSLAVLVAFAAAWLLSKLEKVGGKAGKVLAGGALLILAGAVIFEHAAVPLPLSDARVPDIYRQIAAEPGNFSILSIPWGLRNSFGTLGAEDTRTQYYQSVHGKYLLSGNTSRNPPFLFDYFDRISFFHSLSQIELYQEVSPEVVQKDKAEAASLASFFDIRYVVVNAPLPGRVPYSDTRGAALDYIREVMPLGEKVYDRDGVIAYKVKQAVLPAQIRVTFGGEGADLYQGEGWDRAEVIDGAPANWSNQSSARLLLPVHTMGDYRLTLRALPFSYPGSPPQTMQVLLNSQFVTQFRLASSWSDYAVSIPARFLLLGINDVELRFGYAVPPRLVLPPNYGIGATGVNSPADIAVTSGDFGSIKVNGREVSPLARGYNVVVLDPKTAAVVKKQSFNTGDDKAQSRAMTEMLAQVPDGMIVAVATQGQVGDNLGDRTVAGLYSIGAQADLRSGPQRSQAVIGVKGAARGTALEQTNQGSSFVSVGHMPDDRTLSVALSALSFEKVDAK